MQFEQPLMPLPFEAEAAVTENTLVKLGTGSGQVLPAGANDPVIGVAKSTVAIGQTVDVVVLGATKVLAGGVVTKGDLVAADANAKAVSITLGVVSADQRVAGLALHTSAAADELITILVGRNDAVTVV